MTTTTFDASAWADRVQQIKSEIPSCGGVYEIYVQRFSAAVSDEMDELPDEHVALAQAVARQDPDYFDFIDDGTADEDDGSCAHGLTFMTCPCGCFG